MSVALTVLAWSIVTSAQTADPKVELGKRPVNFQVAAGPTVASPDAGASWRFRLAATFMYPR